MLDSIRRIAVTRKPALHKCPPVSGRRGVQACNARDWICGSLADGFLVQRALGGGADRNSD